jgi:hypothetical protein
MDSMSDDLIRDCSQLVKANSIEGCKKSSVVVVYTPWSNLKKDGGMDVGQVGFFNERIVRKFVVTERDKDVSLEKGGVGGESPPLTPNAPEPSVTPSPPHPPYPLPSPFPPRRS